MVTLLSTFFEALWMAQKENKELTPIYLRATLLVRIQALRGTRQFQGAADQLDILLNPRPMFPHHFSLTKILLLFKIPLQWRASTSHTNAWSVASVYESDFK